jgi:hypothetical protein
MSRKAFIALAVSVLAVHAAHADPVLPDPGPAGYVAAPVPADEPGYAPAPSASLWRDERMASGVGIGVTLGGGVIGFLDRTVRDSLGAPGGTWAARAAIGTHIPVALELGYMGTATRIASGFDRPSALMVGTTFEAALRYNMMPRRVWTPYLFAGLGWQRFSIDDEAFQLADVGIANRDELMVVPMGVGVAYRLGSIVADARGTFRAARGADLVRETSSLESAFAPMHTWDASLNVGYEF